MEALQVELAAVRAESTVRAAVTPTPVPTAEPQATATLTTEQAVRYVLDGTVLVETNKGAGSGVILGAGGIVTSLHVVDGATSVTVRFPDQRSSPAQIVRVDRKRDLALLAAETTENPLQLGHMEGLNPGAPLLGIGFPLSTVIGARNATVTRGIFSGMWRSPDDTWFVQTDTALNPGNSGGPLVDAQGHVVGIVTFGVPRAIGLNYAVAADEIRVFLASADNPPPLIPTPTPRPSLSQQFFQAFDPILAVHEANRGRLGTAYGNYRAGRLSATAFSAEVDYQVTARSLTRQEGLNLRSRMAGDSSLTSLLTEFVSAMDLAVEFVRTERNMLSNGVRFNDDASWKRLEAQGDVAGARFDLVKSRYDARRAGAAPLSRFAVVELERGGSFTIELFHQPAPQGAPKTVENFVQKAMANFYSGLMFHRVEDWVVQGGDPRCTQLTQGCGTGGGQMATELNERPFVVGSVGVARGPDIRVSNDSQFFISVKPAGWLDRQYTNFGQVVDGLDIVLKVAPGDKIRRITISSAPSRITSS